LGFFLAEKPMDKFKTRILHLTRPLGRAKPAVEEAGMQTRRDGQEGLLRDLANTKH
jgi:hypothetical protein